VITESVHHDDSGAPELLAPELDQAPACPRRTGLGVAAVVNRGADEIIDLDEGVRMMTNLVWDEPQDYPSIDPDDDVSIGMRMRVASTASPTRSRLPKLVTA
jgi:hypothetical protein